jgi:succinoglycan biosynthesis protein ExoM
VSVKCVVGIGTFLRPQGLRLLIESLMKAIDEVDFSVAIVVCDNDPLRGAELFVLEMGQKVNYPVYYLNEATPGIAFVRNKVVKKFLELDAEYICFVDDDETVDSLWLKSIVKFADMSKSDLVQGKVKSIFEKEELNLFTSLGFFKKKIISTGTILSRGVTNNLLIKREVFLKIGGFDSQRGVMGGTDSDFTCRAVFVGFIIRFCNEAVVFDLIPASRCTFKWVFQRSLSMGGMTAEARRYSKDFLMIVKPFLLVIKHFIQGILCFVIGAFFIVTEKGKLTLVQGCIKILTAIGLFLGYFNIFYALYGRDEKGNVCPRFVFNSKVSKKYVYDENQTSQIW